MNRLKQPITQQQIELARQRLLPIRSRTDLYERVSRRLIRRAMQKFRQENLHGDDDNTQEARWCEMIAAVAFVMQLAEYRNHVVPHSEIPRVKELARARCSRAVQEHWEADWRMLPKTELTDRGMMTGDGERHLGFRDAKKMEFYAGWHLARFATPQTWEDLRRWQPARGLDNLTSKPASGSANAKPEASAINSNDWYQVWRRALEFAEPHPRERPQVRCPTLCDALELLFESPAGGRRPSELMYRAWLVFQREPFQHRGAEIIRRFQRCAIDLLHDDTPWSEPMPRGEPGEPMKYQTRTVAQLAATLIPEFHVQKLIEHNVVTAERWKQIAPPRWTWFMPSPVSDRSSALRQLQDWKEAGYRERWHGLGENVFLYKDRAFVWCPPKDVGERLEQFLKAQGTSTESEIAQRVATSRQTPPSFMSESREVDIEGLAMAQRSCVRLAGAYWMQTTTVTRCQYALFDPAWRPAPETTPNREASDPDLPVTLVSWYDGFCFALWIGGRLPTHDEWEFGCRAGSDGVDDHFHWGARISPRQANFDATQPSVWTEASEQDNRGCSVPVRFIEFESNLWGLWQMHGNIWEWCANAKTPIMNQVQTFDLAAATSAIRGTQIIRGGAWNAPASYCRSAFQLEESPHHRGIAIGFRVVIIDDQLSRSPLA